MLVFSIVSYALLKIFSMSLLTLRLTEPGLGSHTIQFLAALKREVTLKFGLNNTADLITEMLTPIQQRKENSKLRILLFKKETKPHNQTKCLIQNT